MSRTALARKYRPRRFSELSRQEHVAETLKSAVARGRVAHAYLFAGPRGVGKTTAARVLAMALNCPNRGEDGEPCGACESCERIWAGRTSLDVIEIDAASNRGVDDARDLRERAMYAPTDEHRYKVYIIDEAHMLTREAWNALLKILEEPPPRVIFAFATTEPQKIQQAAPPILSRCQRFDFRRIGVTAIVERLTEVLAREGVEAEPEALTALARRAEGGLRDALSLLDQVLSVVDERVSLEDVTRLLGVVADEVYVDLFEILADRRHGDIFRFVQALVDEGYDLTEFYRGLANALRTRLVACFDGAAEIDVREDLRAPIAQQAARFAPGDLLRMLSHVAEIDVEGRFRKSGNPRVLIETMLLRFAHLDRTVEIETLIHDLEGAPDGGGPSHSPAPRAPTSRGGGGGSGGATRPPAGTAGRSGDAAPRGPGGAPPRGAARAPDGGASRSSSARPEAYGGGGATAAAAGGSTALVAERHAAPPHRAAVDAAPAGQGDAERAFRRVLTTETLPAGMGPFLRAAQIAEPVRGRVRIALPAGPGLERLASDGAARAGLQRALREALGRAVELEVTAATATRGGDAAAPARLTAERVRIDRLERMTREEPELRRVVEEWDLELLE